MGLWVSHSCYDVTQVRLLIKATAARIEKFVSSLNEYF